MRDLLRAVGWLRSSKTWTGVAVALGLATIVTNTGLLAVATYLISAAASHPPLYALAGALALVRLFGLSRAVARYGERLVSHEVTFRLLAELRVWLYRRLVGLSAGQLIALRSADLLARLVRDVDEVQTVFQHLVGPALVAAAAVMLAGWLLWMIDPRTSVLAAAAWVGAGLGVPVLVVARTRGMHQRQVTDRAALDVALADQLQGLPELLAFDQAGRHLRLVHTTEAALGRTQQRLAMVAGLRAAGQDVITRLGAWGVLLLAIPLVRQHTLSASFLATLAIIVLGIAEALEPLAQAAQRVGASRAAAARIWAIADLPPAISFPRDSARAIQDGALEFEHVGFTYDQTPVLTDISFRLRPGQAIGVVGPSGAGKSTLLLLAARAWDPGQGQVRLDGRDLRSYSAETLRRRIGVLSSDSSIFSATLRENLRLGSRSASDRELEHALDLVGLADLPWHLPDGLDTWLGDQGARLSGGQRQRLALARALLADTPLLLLDEPTQQLDALSEASIGAVLRGLKRERGMLVVSHQLSDLDWLDELLVLDGGRVVERGHHSDLSRAGGLYQRLLEVQQRLLIE